MAQKHMAAMPKEMKKAKKDQKGMMEAMYEKPKPKRMRKPAKKKQGKKGY